jgi:hypothetical protein
MRKVEHHTYLAFPFRGRIYAFLNIYDTWESILNFLQDRLQQKTQKTIRRIHSKLELFKIVSKLN